LSARAGHFGETVERGGDALHVPQAVLEGQALREEGRRPLYVTLNEGYHAQVVERDRDASCVA